MDIKDIDDARLLKTVAIHLEAENSRLASRVMSLEDEIRDLKGLDPLTMQQRIAQLEEIVAKRNKALFGASSERRPRAEQSAAPAVSANDDHEADGKRRGHGPRQQPRLPVIENVNEFPAPGSAVCPACGKVGLEPMVGQFEEVERISLVYRQPILIREKAEKCRCSCNGAIVTAPIPPAVQAGGRYTVEFAVEVAVSKYLDHLPLERQARMLKREGLDVDSQTLYDQTNALAAPCTPTYEAIHAEILREPVIHADESPVYLLDKRRNEGKKKWYLWMIASQALVFYRIEDSRSHSVAVELLAGYSGTVMADGYEAYPDAAKKLRQGRLDSSEAQGSFKVVNCMAHARRDFVDIEGKFQAECKEVLDLIGDLYEVEREVPKNLDAGEQLALRAKLRDEKSRPVAAKIKTWLDNTPALPESGLGKAIAYMKNHWAGLTAYLDDPRIPIDNNHGERAMRGPAVGRKNYYGFKSRRGTEVAAILYTLAESAKLAGVDPKAYIAEVARRGLEQPGAVLLPEDFKPIQAEREALAQAYVQARRPENQPVP